MMVGDLQCFTAIYKYESEVSSGRHVLTKASLKMELSLAHIIPVCLLQNFKVFESNYCGISSSKHRI